MSAEGNGKTTNGDLTDPFARGVWILTTMSGADVLALIEGSEGREEETVKRMLEELSTHRSVVVDLRRKYMLKEITFPMPHPNGGMARGLVPGSLPSVSRHENTIELTHAFVSHVSLSWLSFLEEFHPDDVDLLRSSVRNADESAEVNARMIRSNLIVPQTGQRIQ